MVTRVLTCLLLLVPLQSCRYHAGQPESVALERQIREVHAHFEQCETEFESQVLNVDPTVDPAQMIARSMRGDEQAMYDLFGVSHITGLDGAGAEGYAAWLGVVLHTTGDSSFGTRLSEQPEATRRLVRDYLLHDLGVDERFTRNEIIERFPITFSD